MIKQKLIEKFGGVINHMSCIYLNDGENVLRYFLDKVNPQKVVEIGTYQGVSAAIISEYAKEVITIDIVDKPLREEIWDFLEVEGITFYKVNSDSQKKRLIESANADMVFIDGEHFDGELAKDYEMSKDSPAILIHDYAPAFREVYDFCNNIGGWEKEHRGTFMLLTKSVNTEKPKKRRGRPKKVKDA